MYIHGRNLKVYVGGTAIASAKTCGIILECDLIETATTDAGTRTFIVARYTWRMTADCLLTSIKNAIESVGETVVVEFGTDAGSRPSGTAIWKDCKITGTRGSMATCSVTFQGSNNLSRALSDLFWGTVNSEYVTTSNGEKIRILWES